MIPRIRAFATGFLLCIISAFLLFPGAVHSQQTPSSPASDLSKRSIKLSLKAQRFADVITTLSTKLGLNILADDEPLIQKVTLEFDGSVTDALDQVAEAFDYRWKQKSSGIIVMYKRFHNIAEHPQYNLPELRHMAREVAAIFKAVPGAAPVDPHDDYTTCINRFFGVLTAPQVEMLRGGKMLHGSDLNAQQADAFQVAILRHMFSGQIMPWQELNIELDGLGASFFQVKTSPVVGLNPQGGAAGAVPGSPVFLHLLFGLKVADDTVFSQVIAGMQANLASTETKKP
ncbi:MAG: hypothetical protein JWN14_3791 [Chthonomonadales bacterium]|nr:hypothetical protein [Chthonomonadales bacterium]